MTIDVDNKKNDHDDVNEIDILEMISILWDKKFLIGSITSIAAVMSVLYALYLPNIYVSSALLAPADQQQSNSGMLGQLSGVASLAGISIGGESADKSLEAIERIRSFDFFSKYFLPEISLEDLVIVDRWDPSTDTLSYENGFDATKKEWEEGSPTEQEAYEVYSDIVNLSQDKKTFFIYLSVKHKSPNIARDWNKIIINKINDSMRIEDKIRANKSINFLNKESEKVNYQEIRQAISSLQESQMKSLMLIEANEEYIFKVIDSPIAPEKKSEPKRSLIAIIGTILGFFGSSIFALVNFYFRKK